MENFLSPPAWWLSQESDTRLSSPICCRTWSWDSTSKAAPVSPALRQLRRSTPWRRPAREKCSSGTVADSPVFWMAKPSSTTSGSTSGPMA